MNLHNLHDYYTSLMAKQAFKIFLSNTTPWLDLISAKYNPNLNGTLSKKSSWT